jgi:hypothetical protein
VLGPADEVLDRRVELLDPRLQRGVAVQRRLAEEELDPGAQRYEHLDEAAQGVDGVRGRRARGEQGDARVGHRLRQPVDRVVGDGEQQRVPGRVALVQRGATDARGRRDLPQRGTWIGDEYLGRDLQQAGPGDSPSANIHVHEGASMF